MELKNFKYLHNFSTDSNIAEIRLYKTIGSYMDENGDSIEGINGNDFADEIERLQSVASQINVRINSYGGDIMDGYCIVSAILNSKVPVNTYVDGIAASMAAMIALAGKERHIMDYGTLMIHNPSGSAPDKLLDKVKDSLVKILKNNTSLNEEDISKMMDAETYLSPSEAKAIGFVHNIITSEANAKIEVDKTTSPMVLYNIYNNLLNTKNNNKMKSIKNKLNLDENVNEEVIVKSISKLQDDNDALLKLLETERSAKQELQNKLEAIEKEKEDAKKNQAIELVNSFINEGKLSENERETTIRLALVDFEGVKNMLGRIGVAKTPVKIFDSAKINNNLINSERAGWNIRDYEKNDPTALMKIYKETPELYNQMYNAYYKK